MHIARREFVAGAAALAAGLVAAPAAALRTAGAAPQGASMYGLIGKMIATPGQRDALIAILVEGTGAMPGCLSYVVATDPADANAIWITEVWDSKASHEASLALPAVRDAIAKGRPLIAGFSNRIETEPLGGHWLTSHSGGEA